MGKSRKKRFPATCLSCGKITLLILSKIKRRKYCSIGCSMIGNEYWLGKHHGERSKEKLRLIHLGKPMSQVAREHMSLARKGKPSNMKGKKMSVETKLKLSSAHKGLLLKEKSPFYKGEGHREEWKKKYRELNRELFNLKEQKRRVAKTLNGGSFTLKEWQDLKRQCGFKCLGCFKREPDISLTIDHINPVIKGGSNNIDNIQPLCRSCNSKKGTRVIRYAI